METIKLTEAELKMIELKREEARIQQEKDALKEQLEYDKLLHSQDESIKKQIDHIVKNNARLRQAFKILKNCGLGDNDVRLDVGVKDVGFEYSYQTEKLKPEDIKTSPTENVIIHTNYGNITAVDINMKTRCPSSIRNMQWSRDYKIETIAQKIKEQKKLDIEEQETKNKLEQAKKELTKQFRESSPEGTQITYERKYNSSYGGGKGYYINTLTILYPNTSWVTINFYNDKSWSIKDKFDSKYIKPETKEAWLEYLQK